MVVVGNRPVLGEGFLKKVEEFGDGVRQIDECFNNRLTGKVIRFGEDYVHNRFGIVIRLYRRGQAQRHWVALCLDACSGAECNAPTVSPNEGKFVFKSDQMGRDDQKPMFVYSVELIEAPDIRRVSVASVARVYEVENERLGLWEGHIYRSIRASGVLDTVREILPRFVSRKGGAGNTVASSRFREGSPHVIGRAVQVMDGVSEVQWQRYGEEMVGAYENFCGVRIVIDSNNIRIFGNDVFNDMFDSVDVLLGPFNLEF